MERSTVGQPDERKVNDIDDDIVKTWHLRLGNGISIKDIRRNILHKLLPHVNFSTTTVKPSSKECSAVVSRAH